MPRGPGEKALPQVERYRQDPAYRAMILEKARLKRLDLKAADPEGFLARERAKCREKWKRRTDAQRERRRERERSRRLSPAQRERKNEMKRMRYARKRASAAPVKRSSATEPVHHATALARDPLWSAICAELQKKSDSVFWDEIASEAVIVMLEGGAASPAEAIQIGRRRLNKAIGSHSLISLDQPMRDGGSWHDILAGPNAPTEVAYDVA